MGEKLSMTLERWDARIWERLHTLYDRASPATRIVVGALLFVTFVALIAYVDVSAYLDKAAKARSASFGPTIISPPVAIRPPAAAQNPEPILAPVNLAPAPHAADPAPPLPAPRVQRLSQQGDTVRWIHGDRD